MKRRIETLQSLLKRYEKQADEAKGIDALEAESKAVIARIKADGEISAGEETAYARATLTLAKLPARRRKLEEALAAFGPAFAEALELGSDEWNRHLVKAYEGRKREVRAALLPFFKRLGPPSEDDPRDPQAWIEENMGTDLDNLPAMRELARLHYYPSCIVQGGAWKNTREIAEMANYFVRLFLAWEIPLERWAAKAK